MRHTNSLVFLGAAMAAAAALSHCERFERSDDPRARAVVDQGEQRARQLRAQADSIEHAAQDQAHREAEAMRAQARDVERTAHADAEQIRRGDQAVSHSPATRGVILAPGPTARGGGPAGLTDAMNQYARARCEREVRCNNVGLGRAYRDADACVASEVNDRSREWEAANECRSNGVNAAQLSECVTAARNDDCANPFDDITRATACRAAEVCGH